MPFKFLAIATVAAISAVHHAARTATAQNWNQILTASLPSDKPGRPGCMTGANTIAAMIAMKQNSPQLTDDWIKENAYSSEGRHRQRRRNHLRRRSRLVASRHCAPGLLGSLPEAWVAHRFFSRNTLAP